MERAVPIIRMLRGAFLIAGNTVGAGMLCIPLVTASCGFFPAAIITMVVWVLMMFTGLILLEAALAKPGPCNFLDLSKHYLGKKGQLMTSCLFLFLYSCLLVAYFAAGTPIFTDLIQIFFGYQINYFHAIMAFFLVFAVIVAFGPRSIDNANFILTLMMIAFWIGLFFIGLPAVKVERVIRFDLLFAYQSVPILFSAFGYHNIIPSLVNHLNRDRYVLKGAIILGSTIPLIMYLLWQWLVIGSMPLDIIGAISDNGLPITFAFSMVAKNSLISQIGQIFALLAVITSILTVAFAFLDFLSGVWKMRNKGFNRLLLTLLIFSPPFFFSLIHLEIFDKALTLAGGVGESLVNGVIPVALLWSLRYVYKEKFDPIFLGGKIELFLIGGLALCEVTIELFRMLLF